MVLQPRCEPRHPAEGHFQSPLHWGWCFNRSLIPMFAEGCKPHDWGFSQPSNLRRRPRGLRSCCLIRFPHETLHHSAGKFGFCSLDINCLAGSPSAFRSNALTLSIIALAVRSLTSYHPCTRIDELRLASTSRNSSRSLPLESTTASAARCFSAHSMRQPSSRPILDGNCAGWGTEHVCVLGARPAAVIRLGRIDAEADAQVILRQRFQAAVSAADGVIVAA